MNLSALSEVIPPLNLRSCLISREGRLVFEYYRDDRTLKEIARINSCTKSVLSALICIAMDQGLLPQPAAPAAQFFPQLQAGKDVRRQEITLQHLLTMSAGFKWNEFGGLNSFPKMTKSPNWVEYVLEQPLADAPGTRMEYNSGVSQLLSAILVQASGMTTAEYAGRYLFGPLGIEAYEWEQDPQGIHTGGFGLRLRPADLLKFGQLYLQQGVWEGNPVISREQVARSTEAALPVDAPHQGGYGWHWWTDAYPLASSDGAAMQYYYARGYGGQFVYVLPELAAVVVLTQDKQGKSSAPAEVFRELIAPALAAPSGL
ncbi:serine hydrolase domain-containing protein [Paenibacillus sp. HW567]|uniref:serine hydrolase domain-containing protein n=1 Tax=Paenibacillus sp. HW567 TaxID=1034769 RepID=UPI00035C3416|nr:serine hydrolase [Paenibacillus sp. HW567]